MTTKEELFWSHVNKRGPRAGKLGFCWIWKTTPKKYAYFNNGTKTVLAHRWSWENHHHCRICIRDSMSRSRQRRKAA